MFLERMSFNKAQTFDLVGATADFANHRGVRRIQCFSIVAAFFLVSQVVGILAQDNQQLRYAVILVGISYGAVFGLSPIVVLDWFGIGPCNRLCLPELQRLTYPSDYSRH